MFNQLILSLEKYNYKFVTTNFKAIIKENISNKFAMLNNTDVNILIILTSYMIEDLMERYNINEDKFTQYNARDIISLCLTLLPFIKDDKYHMIKNLKDILYIDSITANATSIPSTLLDVDIKIVLKDKFPFSNISLGLLNQSDNGNLLELYNNNNNNIIYTMIHNNFVSMLETIKITCGKLFVNWINVVPINSNYKETNFYKTSQREILNILNDSSEKNILQQIKNNKGLWLGDYYNILTNGYYLSIKSKKWMIFCRNINNKYYYAIQYLNKIFNINKMLIYENYESMTDIDKTEFNNIKQILQNNIKNNITTYSDINFEIDLFKNLFIFMTENFSKKRLLSEFFFDNFSYDTYNSNVDLDPDEDIYEITHETISKAVNEITPDLLWNYIKESVTLLKTTVYGSYLIIFDKTVDQYIINMDFFFMEIDDKINLKNIYNIAKLLCHDTNDIEFPEYCCNFKGITQEQTIDFFKKYQKLDIDDKIRKNIKMQEGNMIYDYNKIIKQIENGWYKIRQTIIWKYLIYCGLLIEFRTPIIKNMSSYAQKEELKSFFNNNSDMFNMNYFMTNEPYSKLKIYNDKKIDKKEKYSDLLLKQSFYTFYANDWISQLNFFNHYINKSIMYVTGSTGTGKSTQIPKLTLYILKMYDYKLDGIVIITQPRIPPTEENAKRIASEMGLELNYIKNSTNSTNSYNTDNYYIQYKHMKGEHLKDYCSHLVLRTVTDGTLLEDLVQNPLLKETYKDKKHKNSNKFSYGFKNKYDVVIVDEAHEHNMNMDIILTLMRQTCIYNNMIRLIIVSATMEEDEPIYRYYYKLVNDNIVYPIKQPLLIHPILEDINFMINSYLLDRRLNISAPGQTTMYKVTDNYNEIITTGDNMRNNYNMAIESAYSEILNICKKYLFGDILLFSIGKAEIIESVNRMNMILPNDTIALPYYSEMAPQYRNMINKISENIGKIRNKKNKIGEEWGSIYTNATDVSENTYKRAIIIATNVAEASITISSLKFVVDTGYSKVNRYNVINDSSEINIEMISESSRIQRRGRVGRTGDGMVYYMYGKNKRQNVIPKYGITLVDFHSTFLKLAVDSSDSSGSNPLWEDILSPYLPLQYRYYYYKIVETVLDYGLYNIIDYNIINIIIKQFPQSSMNPTYDYFYKFNEYFPQHKQGISQSLPYYLNRYASGYTKENLFDVKGLFYIVHPFEDIITRNIMGHIIKVKNKNETKIKDEMFQPMLNYMKIKMLYFNINSNNNNNNNNNNSISEGIYKKTVYSEKIIEVMRLMSCEENQATILLLGAGYNILVETCMVHSIIQAISKIQPMISVIIKKVGKYIMYDEAFALFNSNSDITSLYMITQLLQKKLCNMEIFKIISAYKKGEDIIKSQSSSYSIFMIKYKLLKNSYYNNMIKDPIVLNMFKAMQHKGLLEDNKGFIYWLSKSNFLKDKIILDIKNNLPFIITCCDNLYLDYNIVIEYLNNLLHNILNILSIENTVDTKYNEMHAFDWIKQLTPNLMKNLKNDRIETKLNLCFFFAQPFIAVKNNKDYINLKDGTIIGINSIFNKNNTFCNNIGSYIYYYSQSKNMMSLIANIDPLILPIYYPLFYNNYYIKSVYTFIQDNNYIRKEYNNIEWINLINIVKNNYSYLSFPFFTPYLPVIEEYIINLKI